MNRKILVGSLALLFFLVLATIFITNSKNFKFQDSSLTRKPETDKMQAADIQEEKILLPTGNVDDTVDAIINESNSENNLVSGVDDVAKDAVNNTQEADDLANAYDENEL